MKIDHASLAPAGSAEVAPPRSRALLGSIFNAFGEPIDLRGRPLARCAPPGQLVPDPQAAPPAGRHASLLRDAAVRRETVRRPFSTGIRAIDGLLTLGAGQRIALLADSEAGKSELLASIARHGGAAANVILLAETAPRELRRFVESGLGHEAMRPSILIAVLANEPPAHLTGAAALACHLAARLCDDGQDVLLAVDTLSHLESAGVREPAGQLLACAGNRGSAAITGLYALDAASDHAPLWPRFDALIRLRRDLAERGYLPALDLLQSWRRGNSLATPEHQQAAELVHRLLAAYDAIEQRLNTAAYRTGLSFEGDLALRTRQAVLRYLQQSAAIPADLAAARRQLLDLRQEIENAAARLRGSFSTETGEKGHSLRLGRDELGARALAG